MSFLADLPPWVFHAAGIAGAAGSAASSVMAGVSQAAGLTGQARASRYNAAVSRQSAEAARGAAAYEAGLIRAKGRRLSSQQEALYGASGVELEGSPLLVMEETAANVEREALAAIYGGEGKARRFESEAGQYGFMAQRAGSMAGGAIGHGLLGGFTTLMSTAAKYGYASKGGKTKGGGVPFYAFGA